MLQQWLYFSIFCLSFAKSVNLLAESGMQIMYAWKALDFDFPNETARAEAIKNGKFIPGVSIPIDVDVYEKDDENSKIFVTIPRLQNGVPVTIGYVTDKVTANGDPIIAPYPNWEWNQSDGCKGITSVYRVKVDADCKRIWILDSGRTDSNQVCPPQILSFSLEDDKLLSKYVFPKNQLQKNSILVTPVLDLRFSPTNPTCQDAFVYIADVTSFAMIVYDHRNAQSWRIVNNYFHPDPRYGSFNINGDRFNLMDGIVGMALGPPSSDGDRILFFQSLSSVETGWVRTSVIRNRTLFQNNSSAAASQFHLFRGVKSSQSSAVDIDRNGIMFFGLMGDLAIACWNINEFPNYGGNTIDKVFVNPDTMQFPAGVKVVSTRDGYDQLWVLTSSLQKLLSGQKMGNGVKFRIQAALTDDLVRFSKCGPLISNDDFSFEF